MVEILRLLWPRRPWSLLPFLLVTSIITNDTVFDKGLHSAIFTSVPSSTSTHPGIYACNLDLLLSYLLYFGTGCGYSRATTAIFFAFVLIIVPLYIFPRTERTPWKGQSLSSHDFRGGVTEIPIFLTNFIQLSKVL